MTTQSPFWFVSPDQQIERMRRLNSEREWGFADTDFPAIPSNVQLSATEVLLLAVYLPDEGETTGTQRTFDEHVAIIRQQLRKDYHCLQNIGVRSTPDRLRLHKTREHRPGLCWVAYSYAAYSNPEDPSPLGLWEAETGGLAASEVLSAIMLFPEYGRSIGERGINLPGYQNLLLDSAWNNCLFVRWVYGLALGTNSEMEKMEFNPPWGSPVVREC